MSLTRKQEIIITASRLFKERGYNAISMRDLAAEMGIKAASLYNHISSKQEILGLIILKVAEEFTQHINTIYLDKLSSIKKLEAIIQNHIEITLKYTHHLACMNNDWIHLEDEYKQRYLNLRNEYESKFRQILQQGKDEGELKDIDLEIVVFSVLTTLRTLHIWYAKKTSIQVATLQQDLPKTLLYGIVNS